MGRQKDINEGISRLVHEQFDADPVFYCKECLSLNVRKYGDSEDGTDYCDECGCTSVGTTDIDTWQMMYEKRYKHKYIQR